MAQPFLYLASPCYGGLAHARYMRSVLALRAACAGRGVVLQLDLGGGEALISRARAGMLARFLATAATHLLFVDGDAAFDPGGVLGVLDPIQPIVQLGGGALLISREAARRTSDAHPNLQAGLGDVRGGGVATAAMVFEPLISPQAGDYVVDLMAFEERLRAANPAC